MSHAYHSHHRPAEARPRQDHGQPRRHAAPRPAPRKGRDYTLAHAGRQWRVPPIAFWMFIGALMIMAVWSAATATYFAFRDDLLTRLIARQADMQYAYEDRVADLRQQIDRLASRQMLDQEQFEQKLEQLIRRQAVLEGRAAAISALPDATPTGSVRPSRSSDGTPMPRPSPISDTPATTREPALRPRMAALGPQPSRAQSRTPWRGSRARSTASKRARTRRSPRSKTATKARPSASARFSPNSALHPRRAAAHRPRAGPTFRCLQAATAASSASSRASSRSAPRSTG
jgi:hypothetical protein